MGKNVRKTKASTKNTKTNSINKAPKKPKVPKFKVGDFIYAQVKGCSPWPARIERVKGPRYDVYFYGTEEKANLPESRIYDYKEHKDDPRMNIGNSRYLTVPRRIIQHDYENNIPLDQVIGVEREIPKKTTQTNEKQDEKEVDAEINNESEHESSSDDEDDEESYVDEDHYMSDGYPDWLRNEIMQDYGERSSDRSDLSESDISD